MPNWLSMTWENDRLLLLSAKMSGKTATFEEAATLTVPPPGDAADAASFSSAPSLKKQLDAFVREHRLVKAETVVVLSRADVEVRSMVFPPVPIEELPDLVKFQAAKEFNGYDPNSPLDFFVTNKLDNVSRSMLFPALRSSQRNVGAKAASATPGGAPRHLIASTIRFNTLRDIRQFCEELNLTLRHVVLRSCETAFLLRREERFQPDRTVLLVELDANETSQTVLYQGEPVFMRSPRISCPEDVAAADFAARLIAELKRTRVAVRNEIQGVTVDEVVLCGVGERFENLVSQVSESLEIPARTFDAWKDVRCDDGLKAGRPDKPERFAPLVASILRSGAGRPADIDFCNPKKRPEPIGQRQLITGALAAVFFLLICVIGYGFYSRITLNDDVRKLSARVAALTKTAGTVSVERAQLNAVNAWLADDVNWFEQLGWLSRKAPGSRDMMLNELTMTASNGGSMTLRTFVRDSSVVSPMEDRLRDEKHEVNSGEKGEVKGNPFYGFRFNLAVSLSKASAAVGVPEIATEPEDEATGKETGGETERAGEAPPPENTGEAPRETPASPTSPVAGPPSPDGPSDGKEATR